MLALVYISQIVPYFSFPDIFMDDKEQLLVCVIYNQTISDTSIVSRLDWTPNTEGVKVHQSHYMETIN